MNKLIRRAAIVGGLTLLFAVSASMAQQPAGGRLRGTIETVEGSVLTLRARDGQAVFKIKVADNAQVVSVVKSSLADIKEGTFIGSGAIPQPDGTQKALEVHIFADAQRGTGEGHRPWDAASNGTMTNGTVGAAVTDVDGQTISVKYSTGEKKIIVPPGVPIVRYEIGSLDDLKPGARVTVTSASKQPDGTYAAARFNVGRDGVVPF